MGFLASQALQKQTLRSLSGPRRLTLLVMVKLSGERAAIPTNDGAFRHPCLLLKVSPEQEVTGSLHELLERTHLHHRGGRPGGEHLLFAGEGIRARGFGFAGTFTALTLNRPGRVKLPTPFLCAAASTVCSSAASTVLTCFVSTLAC